MTSAVQNHRLSFFFKMKVYKAWVCSSSFLFSGCCFFFTSAQMSQITVRGSQGAKVVKTYFPFWSLEYWSPLHDAKYWLKTEHCSPAPPDAQPFRFHHSHTRRVVKVTWSKLRRRGPGVYSLWSLFFSNSLNEQPNVGATNYFYQPHQQ